MAEFIDTHRGGKVMLYEQISALFERFKEGQYSLSDFLDAIKCQYMSPCSIFIACLLYHIYIGKWHLANEASMAKNSQYGVCVMQKHQTLSASQAS